MKFYVYEWYRIEDDYVFYVGKGSGRRKNIIASRNKEFKLFLSNNNCSNRIICETESEEIALNFENFRIMELHDIGQAHCNLTEIIGGIMSKESREKISNFMKEHNPMKVPKQKQRMREDNPMKDSKQRKRMSLENPMKDPEIAKKTFYTTKQSYNNRRYEILRVETSFRIFWNNSK